MSSLRKVLWFYLVIAVTAFVGAVAKPVAKWYDAITLRNDLHQRAESGESAAQARLGKDYLLAQEGIPRDCSKAIPLLTTAAHHHNDQGLLQLGWALQHGICVKEDDAGAFHLYMESVALGNATAMKQLGWLYENGIGVPKDLSLAVEWYKKAAEYGNAHAAHNLSDSYLKGRGVPKDDCLALKYMKQSADGNDPEGLYSLGRFHETAVCTDKDEVAACSCFQKARTLGNADAQHAIKRLQLSGLCPEPISTTKTLLGVVLLVYPMYLGFMSLLFEVSPRIFYWLFEASQGLTTKIGSISIPIGRFVVAPLSSLYKTRTQNDPPSDNDHKAQAA